MRILHLTGGNLLGGAARGAYWLHKGLLSVGVDSTFVIQRNTEFHHDITSLESNRILKMESIDYLQLNYVTN